MSFSFEKQHTALVRLLARHRVLLILAALAVWSFLLWRALLAFGPGSEANGTSFSSDSAIPVLMANDKRPITIFNFYYYGADRWGAWPFMVAQLIDRAIGVHWTAEGLMAFQIVWVFLGVWALMSLTRDAPLVAGVAYLIAACLHKEGRYFLFELSQLYAWQTTALLLSWASLRRLFDSFLELGQPFRAGRSALWVVLTLGSSFLATWSSVASTVFLALLLAVEMIRAHAKMRGMQIGWRLLMPASLGFFAAGAASLLERQLKVSYRRYSDQHYGTPFVTIFNIDTGNLTTNLSTHWHHLAQLSWWPLYVLPVAALFGLVGVFVWAMVTRRQSRDGQVAAVLALDTAVLALGAIAMAAANFALTVLVDHVRLNDYDVRYLTLTNLFGPISGILTLFLVITWAVRSTRARSNIHAAFVIGSVGLLAIWFPVAIHTPRYELLARTASILALRAPGGVLMGSYWDTYVFTAMQSANPMIPVPFEGESFRTPWTPPALQQARDVIVARARPGPRQAVSFPEALQQYGHRLRLVDAHWYDDDLYSFSMYVVDR